MNGFEFRNRMLKLNIAGVEFEIEGNIGEKLARQKDALVGAAKAYQVGKKTEEETISFYAEQINKTLGDKEAFAKIFKSRIADVRDCMDVLTYIANEVAAFNQTSALIKGAIDISSPNRSQRRTSSHN